jgi:hypothetical protein
VKKRTNQPVVFQVIEFYAVTRPKWPVPLTNPIARPQGSSVCLFSFFPFPLAKKVDTYLGRCTNNSRTCRSHTDRNNYINNNNANTNIDKSGPVF